MSIVSKYYHTIKYLKVEQMFFQFYYKTASKLRRLFNYRFDYTDYKYGHMLRLVPFPAKSISYLGGNEFCFLNLRHQFCGFENDSSLGDLWRYNLNYMDYLLQPSMTAETGYKWISCFIDTASANKIASDPYPISLRGINWIKFMSLHCDSLSQEQRKKIDTFLYSQYKILGRRLERHLLANHYLENGFSLLFAAVYFRDKIFWKKSYHILCQQMDEQILRDGAHYELSPMYHCILLERTLDACNLLQGMDDGLFDETMELKCLLQEKAAHMLAWLEAIVVDGEQIPLLNDAANGIAFPPSILRHYAESLSIKWDKGKLSECGYRHVTRANYEMIIDMAPLGVSYNLGHAHADSTTFLLWVNKKSFLVDTGTSTYNAGERRAYERSTRAHNAVVIAGRNSSNVWGAFRCAQRARAEIVSDSPDYYAVRHNGYYHNEGVLCSRSYKCGDEFIEVVDTIDGEIHSAVAYFHLSPEVKVMDLGDDYVVTENAIFYFHGHKRITLELTKVAESYNQLSDSECLCIQFDGILRTTIKIFCK